MTVQSTQNGVAGVSLLARLDYFYEQINAVILARQNPVTGLMPASTAVNKHGDYTDAWVRDNVYSILAVWGLAVAYRKVDEDRGRTFELEGCVVKLMRGLLFAMMRQADKVERFKETQAPGDALHAKYSTDTGGTVVGDGEWGHLQLDATSLFLLMLGQMTASGLNIVFTIDEVNFVQNLVYYIGRAYQTPDYGIWERGNKLNSGYPELNASSVGMAKAALEALNGLDLFGVRGSQASVLHVLPDEIARARITLESLLPWESSSKEVDAALLGVIGFPAFAVEDAELVARTRTRVVERLQGYYGCKRFLRDGHQTVIEDVTRLHYEPWELKQFEHIECEWPLFFAFLRLDCIYRHDAAGTRAYRDRLEEVLVERDGLKLLPELYYVPRTLLEAERREPHSQPRCPNDNIPLVWAQSLYYLGQMLDEGLLHRGDIDPLGRHHRVGREREPVVQIALLAEDEALQFELEAHGISTRTPPQIAPIALRHGSELAAAYNHIGRNDKLRLTGRPIRRLRSLTTSKLFRIRGELMVFLPSFSDAQQFYLTLDEHVLVAQMKSELAYIRRHWRQLGRPTMTLLLTHRMWETGRDALVELIGELQQGCCNGTTVRLGELNQLMATAGKERIDYLHDFQFQSAPVTDALACQYCLPVDRAATAPLTPAAGLQLERVADVEALVARLHGSKNLYAHVEVLQHLVRHAGLDQALPWNGSGDRVTVAQLLDEVEARAARGDGNNRPYWSIVRRVAGLKGKIDFGLADAVTDILVRQKQITVGKAYFEDALIARPLLPGAIVEKIRRFAGEDVREFALTQEILIALGLLIKAEPRLFDGLLTLRVSYMVLLMTTGVAEDLDLRPEEAHEHLMQSSPSAVQARLRCVLEERDLVAGMIRRQEELQVPAGALAALDAARTVPEVVAPPGGWLRYRQRQGSLNRVPHDFYPKIWDLLHHCQGLVVGEKLELRHRLDSQLMLSEMTADEKNFAVWVEQLLNKIEAPEYRWLNIETLVALADMVAASPALTIDDFVVLDVLIGHAVRLAWTDRYPDRASCYSAETPAAWRQFYALSPAEVALYTARALQLLAGGVPTPAPPEGVEKGVESRTMQRV